MNPTTNIITPADPFSWNTDSYLNTDHNWDTRIAETCIIAIKDNPVSEKSAQTALESCLAAGQINPQIYAGYDGTNLDTITTPHRLQVNDSVMKWIKVLDSALSITEVACALSHISLWAHCITINRPIVILEHDAYMLRPFEQMSYTNSVEYLGHDAELPKLLKEAGVDDYTELAEYYRTVKKYPDPVIRLPVINVINYNFLYSHGLHAYAIDPFMARRLFARVLLEGLINPIDVVVEVTDFELVQTGIYATLSRSKKTSTIDPDQSNIFSRFLKKVNRRKNTYSVPGVSQ